MGRLLKNCNDGRFLRVEDRLFRTLGYYLKRDSIASIEVSELTSKAKIWKSTFYDHFKNMDDAIIKYDHRFDCDIKELCNEIIDMHIDIESAIFKILYFISKHKNYYSTCLHRQNLTPISSIAKICRPIFVKNWSNFGREKFDFCFRIFSGELYGVIHYWGDYEHFDDKKIKTYAIYLSNLAKNATRRLS